MVRIEEKIKSLQRSIEQKKGEQSALKANIEETKELKDSSSHQMYELSYELAKQRDESIGKRQEALLEADTKLREAQATAALVKAHKTGENQIAVARTNASTERFKSEKLSEYQDKEHQHNERMAELNAKIAENRDKIEQKYFLKRHDAETDSQVRLVRVCFKTPDSAPICVT